MKKILLIFFCFLSVYFSFGQGGQLQQDKTKLERERQEIQREIQDIQNNYNKVKGQTKASLAQLSVLQRKLELQDQYINNINHEIKLLSDDIYLSNQEITRLQRQMDTLKAQYAKSVVYAYKNSSSYDYLNFIFSATGFNDALKRLSYLKSYRAYRQQQANTILETEKLIQNRRQQLQGKQAQKKSALENQQQQLNVLEDQKKEKASVVAKLKSQEKDLSKELATKKKRDSQLRSMIAAIIRRDIERDRRAQEERDKNTLKTNPGTTNSNVSTNNTKTRNDYVALNDVQRELNTNFERNKGNLPWPVDNGVVSIPFGRSNVGGVIIDNPGITISTPSSGTTVKAVFDGEVSSVSNLGDGMVVVIRHGKYYTAYSNLSSVSVSTGSSVKTGQTIGKTAEADDGTGGQVDLMMTLEKQTMNPQSWLHRR